MAGPHIEFAAMVYTVTQEKQKHWSPGLSGNLQCMAAVGIFAFGFPAAEKLLETWGIISLIMIRNGLALALLLGLLARAQGMNNLLRLPWMQGFWVGAIGFGIGSLLLLVTQYLTNAVNAALAAATMPVFAVVLEVILDKRQLTKRFLGAVALVLAGGFVATNAELGNLRFGWGFLLGLLATSFYAWGSRATVKHFPGLTPLARTTVTTGGMFGFCAIAFGAALVFKMPATHVPAPEAFDIVLLLIYAWGALAISQLLWIKGVGQIGIAVASFHLNATPFYVMLILLMFGNDWNWVQAAGAFILALGVIIAQSNQATDRSLS